MVFICISLMTNDIIYYRILHEHVGVLFFLVCMCVWCVWVCLHACMDIYGSDACLCMLIV